MCAPSELEPPSHARYNEVMLLDDWTSLIQNVLSPGAFKTVAAAALHSLYQRPVKITDGPGDGGVDAWIDLHGSLIPVQFHSGLAVEWHAKLAQDLEKPGVRAADSKRLFFLCAQTPQPEAVRRRLADLEVKTSIAVELIDARQIAQAALESPDVLAPLLEFLPSRPDQRPPAASSMADDAKLAFVFFHDEAADFREEVARCCIKSALARNTGGLEEESLLDQALVAVGGEGHLRGLFRRQAASLIESGLVARVDGKLVPSTDLVRDVLGKWAAGEQAKRQLIEACASALQSMVHTTARRLEAVEAIFDDLGVLLQRSVVERLPGSDRDSLMRRLNGVERRLSDMLKPTAGSVHEALNALVDVARASVYGRALAAAELFVHFTRRQLGELSRALTGRDDLEIVVDTSVAMPMLCAKFDRVVRGWVTSEVAFDLFESLRSRGMRIVVPNLYVEEMAAHLISAARNYTTLVGEEGLTRSENFFVAHYHSVTESQKQQPTEAAFREFLSDLGLPRGWVETDDFLVARAKVQKNLAATLAQYGIHQRRVSITHAVNLPNEPARPATVLEHDRRVAAWLDKSSSTQPVERSTSRLPGLVLCSQDRWLLGAVAGRDWLAVDQVTLLDLISIVRPLGIATPLISLRELASHAEDATLQRAARVWDMLAELEGPKLADRDLLRRAREYKAYRLSQPTNVQRPEYAEWLRFKERLSVDG